MKIYLKRLISYQLHRSIINLGLLHWMGYQEVSHPDS